MGVALAAAALAGCASAASEDKKRERPAREVISGGARIRGGGVRMDVTVGHAIGLGRAKAGTTAVTPVGVVTP